MKNYIFKASLIALIVAAQKTNAGLAEFVHNVNEHKINQSMCFAHYEAFINTQQHLNFCQNNRCNHAAIAAKGRQSEAMMVQSCAKFLQELKEQEALAEKYKASKALLSRSN